MLLKKISLMFCLLVASLAVNAQEMKWYNPADASFHVIQGQVLQDEARDNMYHRLPADCKETLRSRVWSLSKQSAGLSLSFRTNAKEIKIRYKVALRHAMPHMPATGVSGLDLFTYNRHGKEVWLPGKYSFKDTVTYTYGPIEIANVKSKFHRYTLYLPLYNEVEWLEIGVADGSKFRFEAPMQDKPIVAYGTSICQGACASRPGMAWTNILQRRLDRTVVNLGFSGNAMHENSIIDVLTEIDAAVYFMDGLPNSASIPAPHLQDTLVKAVHRIRAKRPETPIVLADHLGYPDGPAYKKRRETEEHALKSLEAAYQQLLGEGVKGLYRIRYADIAMTADMTVEASHVTDYGMTTYANAYEPVLREILNAPKGDLPTTIPVKQQRDSYNWMDRHNQILAMKGVGKHYTRIVIGDSIMHFWGGVPTGAPAQRGTDSWEALGGETLNLGCGHDRTENVLWRIQHGELDNVTADKVRLKIGTNNMSAGNTDDEILAGIQAVVEAIRDRLPDAEIKVMGILPRRDREARILAFNKRLAKLASKMGVEYGDPGKKLLLKKNLIDESLFTDGLHPNGEGYRRIAEDFK